LPAQETESRAVGRGDGRGKGWETERRREAEVGGSASYACARARAVTSARWSTSAGHTSPPLPQPGHPSPPPSSPSGPPAPPPDGGSGGSDHAGAARLVGGEARHGQTEGERSSGGRESGKEGEGRGVRGQGVRDWMGGRARSERLDGWVGGHPHRLATSSRAARSSPRRHSPIARRASAGEHKTPAPPPKGTARSRLDRTRSSFQPQARPSAYDGGGGGGPAAGGGAVAGKLEGAKDTRGRRARAWRAAGSVAPARKARAASRRS
jgi:hypothetical protein